MLQRERDRAYSYDGVLVNEDFSLFGTLEMHPRRPGEGGLFAALREIVALTVKHDFVGRVTEWKHGVYDVVPRLQVTPGLFDEVHEF